MNIVYMAKSAWTGLLDTIRSKAGITGSMTVSEAADVVENMSVGVEVQTASASLSSSGTTIEFTGIPKMPAFFAAYAYSNYTLTGSNLNTFILAVVYNGSQCGRVAFKYDSEKSVIGKGWNTIDVSFNDGTLTLHTNNSTDLGFFTKGITYKLYYVC